LISALTNLISKWKALLMNKHIPDTMAAPADGSSMQLIRNGQRELAFACSGQGSPTVVLEKRDWSESAEWETVERGCRQLRSRFSL